MDLRRVNRAARSARQGLVAIGLGAFLGQILDSQTAALETSAGASWELGYSCASFPDLDTTRVQTGFFHLRGLEATRELPVKLKYSAFEPDCRTRHQFKVSETNQVAGHSFSDGGTRGFGRYQIEPAQAALLDGLLLDLPAEPPPPPGDRRLLLGLPRGDSWKTYVYDRADLPERVLEILRLTGGFIMPWVLNFQPQKILMPPTRLGYDAAIALSPDGRTLVFGGWYEALTVLDVETRRPLRSIPATSKLALRALAFSPDGRYLAADERWKIMILDARSWETVTTLDVDQIRGREEALAFTLDGELLLVAGTSLLVYRASSGERLPALPGAPIGTSRYVPSRNGKWAMIAREGGKVELWDVARRKLHVELDADGLMELAEFSPDQTRVAVATSSRPCLPDCERRIRVWEVKTGRLLRDFRAFEMPTTQRVEALSWVPGGDYLLGTSASEDRMDSRLIHVWSLATGRHRADFIGLSSTVRGLGLTPDGKSLVAGAGNGKIRWWDFEAGMKDVAALEASLPLLSQ